MWGEKQVANATGNDLTVTFNIRLSADPRQTAGKKTINMRNGDSIRFVYGDAANPFLNGIELIAIRDGSVIATQEVVIVRGSPLDDQLNRNDTITFYFVSGSFIVQPSNTWTV